MTIDIPNPADMGAPPQYTSWRPGQDSAMQKLLTTSRRFRTLGLPTGIGKSLLAVTLAEIDRARAVILTSTKALQDQYLRDFASLGMVDVRGMSNFPCPALENHNTCDHGPCLAGAQCPLKKGGCPYYDQLRRAADTRLIVTNYSMWMTQMANNRSDEGAFGGRDLIVCDEAHDLPEAVTSFVGARIGYNEWKLPEEPLSHEEWMVWAAKEAAAVLVLAEESSDLKQIKRYRDLHRRMQIIAGRMDPSWAIHPSDWPKGWMWEPVWPREYTKPFVWANIPLVVFASATIRPKTLEYLGVPTDDSCWITAPSPFERRRRPVFIVPGVRLTYKSDHSAQILWVRKIDNIRAKRLDRKGILHTVSYARAKFYVEHTKFQDGIFMHETGKDTRATVEAFKQADCGLLVSPAVHTGVDFPYDQARYQVIGKVPFPTTTDPMVAARKLDDPDYPTYCAIMTLIQTAGRAVRAEDDYAETFIVDESIKWVLKKHREHFPRWFLEAIQWRDITPGPMDLE